MSEAPFPARPQTEELQARLGHLTIVQGIVARMAGYSASVKTFTLTVAAALVAVALDKNLTPLLAAGAVVSALFGLLDCYYLANEKRFRDLYAEIARRPWAQAFDLLIPDRPVSLGRVVASARSISIWGFYPLLLAGFLLLPHIIGHEQPPALTAEQPAVVVGSPEPTGEQQPLAATTGEQPSGSVTSADPTAPVDEPTGGTTFGSAVGPGNR